MSSETSGWEPESVYDFLAADAVTYELDRRIQPHTLFQFLVKVSSHLR